MKVIILGDGLLAKEIEKQTGWFFVSRKKDNIDFNDEASYFHFLKDYDVVLNCIANTDTYSTDKESMLKTNVKGLSRLVDWCSNNEKKLVHISSDYVYANSTNEPSENDVPVHAENWYSYTKLLAEGYVELKSKDYLIIRCGFKEFPYTAQHAWSDVKGNFDYVSNIAEGIIRLVASQREGTYNVGSSDSHTMHDLAKESFPEVNETLSNETMPKDVSMNCMKYKIAITDE